MEAFYVCIIFLGVLLVIGSLFFIVMDRVNGKDFFKEFDRKKDEMFSLVQDSEEMVHELNRMSDYVLTVISDKNKEFFDKSTNDYMQEPSIKIENSYGYESIELLNQVQENIILPSPENIEQSDISEDIGVQAIDPEFQKMVNTQISYDKDSEIKDSLDIKKSKLSLNSNRREILQMIEQGLSNDEISQKLKIGKGEIGLIRVLSR
jgi:DNA-binding NarL/FixJ family response regulator